MTRIASALCAALVLAACDGGSGAGQAQQTAANGRRIVYYRAPMDPSFISSKPGKSPMGMDLVPCYEGDPCADLTTIRVKGATLQRLGVRVAPVERGELLRIVRALGRVDLDEARIGQVNMKFDGWIERLWVNETGQKVKAGAQLFSVYSPELVASEAEYLDILKNRASGPHSEHLRDAARQRLLQFDVPRSFVRTLESTGKAQRTIVFRAPRGGYVIHKTAYQGTFVKKGANLFTIADLDAVWVIADVYELDAPWIEVGQKATVELDYLPGVMQDATVDYVYPVLDPKTRTLRVRLVLKNPKVELKPGMFATVRIHTHPVGKALLVPAEAVIHSGERSVAFVSLGDGRFEPRDLKLGVRGDDVYQVVSGLKEGEQVVTSGEFLLDSESSLREAVARMLGGNLKTSQTAGGSGSMPGMNMGSGSGSMPGMNMAGSGSGSGSMPGMNKGSDGGAMPGMNMGSGSMPGMDMSGSGSGNGAKPGMKMDGKGAPPATTDAEQGHAGAAH